MDHLSPKRIRESLDLRKSWHEALQGLPDESKNVAVRALGMVQAMQSVTYQGTGWKPATSNIKIAGIIWYNKIHRGANSLCEAVQEF